MRRCTQCQVDYPDAIDFCPQDGLKLPPLAGGTQAFYDPLIGSTIDGRYVVDSVLGEGGMGMVYSGRHAIIDKRVAIKVLRKEAAAEETSAQRFLAEAKAASKIGQQNIVDITDFGVLQDGHAYFVMEFLDGPTLGRVMQKGGALSPARAVAIAEQVCRGLHAAHLKGIVHRDMKPENIFVLEREGMQDYVKIVDFGIARDASTKKRLTVAGMVMGTPEYMAPEQASGQETDPRVDQYALGCILYEMLTGQVPFRGENPMQTLTKHVFDAVPLPSQVRPGLTVPRELEVVIMRTLAKKRDERFTDLDQLMRALIALRPVVQGLTAPVASKAELSPRDPSATLPDSLELSVPRRQPALFIALAVTTVALITVAAFALRPPHGTTTPRPTPGQTTGQGVDPNTAKTSPPVVTPPTPTPPTPPTPAAPAEVEIALNSVPPGADVLLGDELLGTTPAKTLQPRGDKAELTFLFRKPGFKETSRKVMPAKDMYVEVLLFRDSTGKHVQKGTPVVTKGTGPTPPGPTKPPDRPRGNSELRNPFEDGSK